MSPPLWLTGHDKLKLIRTNPTPFGVDDEANLHEPNHPDIWSFRRQLKLETCVGFRRYWKRGI
jgi:hypothetical protein